MQKLTGRAAPKWLNRAAGIGVALPCVVPRDWITPPEYEDVEGELLLDEEESEEFEYDERSRMMRNGSLSIRRYGGSFRGQTRR